MTLQRSIKHNVRMDSGRVVCRRSPSHVCGLQFAFATAKDLRLECWIRLTCIDCRQTDEYLDGVCGFGHKVKFFSVIT
jgi:hypothetical protein